MMKASTRPVQKLPSWKIAEKDNTHMDKDKLKNIK